MTCYRNAQEAFLALLGPILANGEEVEVRHLKTRELRSQLIQLQRPLERSIYVPGRRGNIFHAIAESMWVLAGRNDLSYLSAYTANAYEFSDDGATWRAAYGPRLRSWNQIDQFAAVVDLLRTDPTSRRAVMAIFDPDRDFVDSKDIPCNNWLHFLARSGELHLNVAARSTDIWWGFSGINMFEWSLLLELVAYWVHLRPGTLTFFTSSIHLYERHFESAAAVIASPDLGGPSRYDSLSISRYATPWEAFDTTLGSWMTLEEQLRTGSSLDELDLPFDDPLLANYIRMIDVFWAFKRGLESAALDRKISDLGNTDLALSARDYIGRQGSERR